MSADPSELVRREMMREVIDHHEVERGLAKIIRQRISDAVLYAGARPSRSAISVARSIEPGNSKTWSGRRTSALVP